MNAFRSHFKRVSGIPLQTLLTSGLLLTASCTEPPPPENLARVSEPTPAPRAQAQRVEDGCSPDNTPPVVTCQEYSGTAECGGYASGVPGLQYSDNCRIDSVSTDYARAQPLGSNIYTTARVSDGTNTTTCQTRWKVVDTRPPYLYVAGNAEVNVRQGSLYTDHGASYVDDTCEGWRGQGPYERDNPVNTAVLGDYTVTYRATDSSGNTGTAFRTVHVVSDTATVSATGKSLQAHVRHTTTALDTDRFLVLGGYSRAAEEYNAFTRKWTATGLPVTTHRGHTATALDSGLVLVAGGAKSGTSSVEELYDPQTRQWSATGKMSTVRYDHVAALLLDGRVLVAGGGTGESSGGALASAEIYNPSTRTWSATGSMPTARRSPTVTVMYDGQVLVTGGIGTDGTPQTAAELYSPSTGTWTSMGPMGTGRVGHTATLMSGGDSVLVVGGQTKTSSASATTERFDYFRRSWYARSSLSTARRDHAAVLLLQRRVVVLGGYNPQSGILASSEIYDSLNDVWTANASLTVPRYKHTATAYGAATAVVVSGTSNQDSSQTETFALPQYANEN